MYAGVHVGLHALLHAGVHAGLNIGLHVGLYAGLHARLYAGINAAQDWTNSVCWTASDCFIIPISANQLRQFHSGLCYISCCNQCHYYHDNQQKM